MDKKYKPVYVQGTKTGVGVIAALEAHGGINNCNYKGNCNSNIYYIDPETNFILGLDKYTQFTSYIIATAEELKPLKWRAKKGDKYFIISSVFEVESTYDHRGKSDDTFYNCGNYFRTPVEAKEAAEKIKKILLPN